MVRVVHLITEAGRGFTKTIGGRVSIQRAMELRRRGLSIQASSRRVAKQIEVGAFKSEVDAGKRLHHPPDKDLFGYEPHFQTNRKFGHSFYGKMGALVAPFSASMSNCKSATTQGILSAAAWDVAQWLDPIFITDAINWWYGLNDFE